MAHTSASAPGRLRSGLRRIATPSLLVGAGLVVAITLFGLIAPFVVADRLAISNDGMQPPSADHWLGTTQTGQDLFFQAEDGIRGGHVTGVQTLLFRSVTFAKGVAITLFAWDTGLGLWPLDYTSAILAA